jgi:hypothetical protein
VLENYGLASWGGFPQDMRERIDDALRDHGFRNGLDDIFGERFEQDLLGWEHIGTGVKRSLLWRAYRDMVDLLEGTDAETYDEQAGPDHHGNEWVARCSQQCSGAACGACDRRDLQLRRAYVQATDRDLKADPVHPVDHSTIAQVIRLRLQRPDSSRFITNESLEFIIRRAAFQAQEAFDRPFPDIAVSSVRLASDGTGYRERSAGVDYAEFGLTRVADHSDAGAYLIKLAVRLYPWLRWPGTYRVLPAAARLPARPLSLWELEVADDPGFLARRLRWWDGQETVPVLIRSDSFYVGAVARPGDAKKHVTDFWVARDGQRVTLRMLLNGRLGPYQAYAALTGKASFIEAARYTATRLEFFHGGDGSCEGCGQPVPVNLLGAAWGEDYCPRCGDEAAGKVLARTA